MYYELTPKGMCLLDYINKCLDGNEDKIMAYEEVIKNCMKKSNTNREDTLCVLKKVLENTNPMNYE